MSCRMGLYYTAGTGQLRGIQHITVPCFAKREHKERSVLPGSVKQKGK
jgi:hypothetical protein